MLYVRAQQQQRSQQQKPRLETAPASPRPETMNPAEAALPFEIGACYGDSAEPLVDHIILAEFDIDTGR